MHTFTLNVPLPSHIKGPITDSGVIIEIARERAHALNQVVYIHMEGAGRGCPNLWAVSPKGYLSVEGVGMGVCLNCSE
ncbi:MAG TPA: hypothetical protein VM008_05840 [Phycisphaerae bacterium]|nr:hypothetical protein [Phycisphaerae bacterium]